MKMAVNQSPSLSRRLRGITLIELLITLVIGLVVSIAVGRMFTLSLTGVSRQTQVSSLQQNVRAAFDFLAKDARMAGYLGCFTGSSTPVINLIGTPDITNNYLIGVEGYDYRIGVSNAYTLTSLAPANSTTVGDWENNVASAGTNTLPLSTIAGSASGDGLTPGSDVLVVRTAAGDGIRLTNNSTAGSASLPIEGTSSSSAMCSDGSTAKISGLCTNSHVLVASCAKAQLFAVSTVTTGSLALNNNLDSTYVYPMASTEAFPMQTVAYYVKQSSDGTTTSLYRRIFDGDHATGLEQELITGVEMLQIRYGVDTTTGTPDGVIDEYRAAKDVTNWNQVVAIRMSLLIRAAEPVETGITTTNTATVNGITVTFPSGVKSYDRRVFTTTVAVRNRISYF